MALLQGTLDLLILKTLVLGPHHGQGIAQDDSAPVRRGVLRRPRLLYLALQRLEEKGWITGKWGASENNRRARFYTLTRQGRAQLGEKATEWRKLARAIALILGPELGEAD